MKITEELVREVILEVLRELETGEKPVKTFKEDGPPLSFK